MTAVGGEWDAADRHSGLSMRSRYRILRCSSHLLFDEVGVPVGHTFIISTINRKRRWHVFFFAVTNLPSSTMFAWGLRWTWGLRLLHCLPGLADLTPLTPWLTKKSGRELQLAMAAVCPSVFLPSRFFPGVIALIGGGRLGGSFEWNIKTIAVVMHKGEQRPPVCHTHTQMRERSSVVGLRPGKERGNTV